MVEVVLPALRPDQTERLLFSLSKGYELPSTVTLISNEIDQVETYGLNVRIISFRSETYPIGYKDVALRCNIGLWYATEPIVMQSAEDQVAARNTISEGIKLLGRRRFFWGHHRYTSFTDKTVDEIQRLSPEEGRSRERGVNRWHGYQSSYSGALGYHVSHLKAIGGWDMAFMCRHAGEDQQLGYRLSDDGKSYIFEPPYWWHPSEREEWGQIRYTNLCSEHDTWLNGVLESCNNCPYFRFVGDKSLLFKDKQPLIQFIPERVDVDIRWLRA